MSITASYVLLITPLFAGLCGAICYHCFSSDASLEPKVRTHLGTQEDVFFMPLTSRTSACSDKIESDYTTIEGQICSSSPLCVTLTPNIENSTFVVRGCMEYILRHSLKKEDIHREGCYLVRSLPARFPNNFTMEYVLCVCKGDYCNGEQPPDFVPGPNAFHGEMVLRLSPKDDILIAPGKRVQLEISSSALAFILSSWICSFSLLTVLIR